MKKALSIIMAMMINIADVSVIQMVSVGYKY